MPQYEYRVVAAPSRGLKAKGIRSPEARFSNALETLMNSMGAEGWEYQRAEGLPSTERAGLTSTTTKTRHVLVFRRVIPSLGETSGSPLAVGHKLSKTQVTPHEELPEIVTPGTPEDDASQSAGASRMLRDNGVEELSEVSGLTNSLTQLAASRNTLKRDD
ncbi:MAG: DUF4177 domain-containing protein [Roseobacter sp.]